MLAIVVSIGAFLAFKVIFTPLEYILTIPPLSSYVINICFVLFKQREGPQHISSAFLAVQGVVQTISFSHIRIAPMVRP